jgi:hypothetical protein
VDDIIGSLMGKYSDFLSQTVRFIASYCTFHDWERYSKEKLEILLSEGLNFKDPLNMIVMTQTRDLDLIVSDEAEGKTGIV